MKLLKNIIDFLRKPFPHEEQFIILLRNAFVVGLFIFLFLYFFQPFDMDELGDLLLVYCLGFGMITFVTSILFDLIFGYGLGIKKANNNFTFGKWIIYTMGMVLCISIANYIFIRLSFFGYIDWQFLPYMMRGTFLIGIFPMIATGTLALLRQEKKYERIAHEINESPKTNSSISHTNQLLFEIPIRQIRYIEALQNYVKVVYINEAGTLTTKTERATLKKIVDQNPNSPIVKCHRSFLVNREAIISTSGNAQGLILSLSDCEHPIPVSRSFVSVFRSK